MDDCPFGQFLLLGVVPEGGVRHAGVDVHFEGLGLLLVVLALDVLGEFLLGVGGELGLGGVGSVAVVVMLVMFLLFVFVLLALPGFLDHFHLLLDFLPGVLVEFGPVVLVGLVLNGFLLVFDLDGLLDLLFGLLLLVFGEDHGLELVNFGEVVDEEGDKFELEFLLDHLLADVGAVNQLNEQFLEGVTHLEVLHYVVMPFSKYLVLDHLHLLLALSVFYQLLVFPYVLQEYLLYLSSLVVRHHLGHLLLLRRRGRGDRQLDHLFTLSPDLIQFRGTSLESGLLSLGLESLQIFDSESRNIVEGSQQRHQL